MPLAMAARILTTLRLPVACRTVPDPAAPAPADGHCPLCGAANGCSMAAGLDAAACWCMRTAIAPAVLAQLPAQSRGRRCICAACAQTGAAAAAPGAKAGTFF